MKNKVLFTVITANGIFFAGNIQSLAITLQLRGQLDMAALSAGVPRSVAAYGNNVYVGSPGAGGMLYHIGNPLNSPSLVRSFGGLNDPASNGNLLTGPGITTNGYVSLSTNGTTLVAATSNGGRVDNNAATTLGTPDVIQAFSIGSDTLQWGDNSDNLMIGADAPYGQFSGNGNPFGDLSIEGAAVDPVSGKVVSLAWGSAFQYIFNTSAPPTPVTPTPTPNLVYVKDKTGFRDLDFDNATGDIVVRSVTGVARGKRIAGDFDYQTLTGATSGLQRIVTQRDENGAGSGNFYSALNVEFLPSDFLGQELVIMNVRQNKDTPATNNFAGIVKVYDATTPTPASDFIVTSPLSIDFVMQDGVTPFSTADSSLGIYDFSYDPVNKLLYISDESTSQIHIFGALGQVLNNSGDYNGNGVVDAADYVLWRNSLGQAVTPAGSDADGDGNGTIGAGDYNYWRARFGNVVGSGLGAGQVPEPTGIALVTAALTSLLLRRVRY